MSVAMKLGKIVPGIRLGSKALFSEAGRAGPRRLLILFVVGLGIAASMVALTLGGGHGPRYSYDARMSQVDPLPGGLHSTPEQDALADRAETAEADAALSRGRSYTPPIAPSVAFQAAAPKAEAPAPGGVVAAPPRPRFAARPARVYPAPAAIPPPALQPTPAVATGAPPAAIPVVQQQQPSDVRQQYDQQVKELFSQWDARPPRTDIVLPPAETDRAISAEDNAAGSPPSGSRAPRDTESGPERLHGPRAGQILIPAGRGIYAHPVLALSSDQSSPAVFQADSGPIAGDRMIGSFSRENNRLIVRIATVLHRGQAIGADGLVIAPDTMEASVATGVDQHYLTRFFLPAAAAFVQGLGQAIETTSNTTAVLGPLGGATTTTSLNLPRQLGVAAGVAAGNIGSTLDQAAPKGPTIHLDANVPVGVMFLANVTYEPRE